LLHLLKQFLARSVVVTVDHPHGLNLRHGTEICDRSTWARAALLTQAVRTTPTPRAMAPAVINVIQFRYGHGSMWYLSLCL